VNIVNLIINFLIASILAGTPLLFGTVGEILTEKGGSLNLGVEGMMFMGGVAGLAASYYYEQSTASPIGFVSAILAVIAAMLVAGFGALIYSVLTISLRANQNVTGLALTIFGTGFGNFIGDTIAATNPFRQMAVGNVTKNIFNSSALPFSNIPYIGKILFGHNFLVYLAIIVAVITSLVLKRTRTGLNLRAVGESAASADADGIHVSKYRYLSAVIGGAICGLGGLYIVMNSSNGVGGVWTHDCISGKGWISVALVIFAVWSPSRAILGSLVFGALSVMRLYIPIPFLPIDIYDLLPFLCTIIVLIFVSTQKKRSNQPPADLGIAYFRENR